MVTLYKTISNHLVTFSGFININIIIPGGLNSNTMVIYHCNLFVIFLPRMNVYRNVSALLQCRGRLISIFFNEILRRKKEIELWFLKIGSINQ